MKPDYVIENDDARRRLVDLLDELGDAELSRVLDNGLTVAAVLMHLAFWDDYAAALLGQWRQTGFVPTRANFEAINAAIAHLASVVPVGSVPGLVKDAAAGLDAQIEVVDPGLAAAIVAGGSERILRRAEHRNLHLDQIRESLQAAGD